MMNCIEKTDGPVFTGNKSNFSEISLILLFFTGILYLEFFKLKICAGKKDYFIGRKQR